MKYLSVFGVIQRVFEDAALLESHGALHPSTRSMYVCVFT